MSYDDTHIDESDAKRIHALFFGRTVAKVAADRLLLDDGTELTVVPNEGCGGCSSGWYELKALNDCPNMITRAEVAVESIEGNEYADEQRYTLFVVAEDKRLNLITVEGDDGNGCYGTGFQIVVKRSSDG